MPTQHPTIARLCSDSRVRPLVASHRGASCEHPENTLSAFRRAAQLGVAIQEFDVRQLACGELICVHDETWDRTTDAGKVLGKDVQVAKTDLHAALRLNAAGPNGTPPETVPTLRQALAVMLPPGVPLIEHKSGAATVFVEFLRAERRTEDVILQSFDWQFLREVQRLAPEICLGALGPQDALATPTEEAIEQILSFDADLLHWRAESLSRADVDRAHANGLLVCTYTTDDEAGWRRGQALGVDAMCTNDPAAMAKALA